MKSKVHEITIKVRFDAPLTAKEAKYAVWNAIEGHQLYGDGKPGRWDEGRSLEPYSYGKIKAPRR